jgi:3',5'-cyclic AMP phosphodiesterase CpdA
MVGNNVSRRCFLRGLGLASLSGALPAVATALRPSPRGCLRVAHLTDCHISPGIHGAAEGFASCLEHMQSHGRKPDLVLNGGDSIFDAFAEDAFAVRDQWATFHEVYRRNCSIPMASCIGNHDIWGWNQSASRTTGRESLYGKKWAMQEFGLSQPYYSFDKGGWHFVVLDSVQPATFGTGYRALLDKDQFEWLEADLAKTPAKPVLVMSHCSILSASALMRPHAEDGHGFHVPASWMHSDSRRIKDLLWKHPNVKLCLSGHEHLHGRVEYDGVTYACNGAVCGSWWQGSFEQTPAGYALVDLFPDGSFKLQYYAWGKKISSSAA